MTITVQQNGTDIYFQAFDHSSRMNEIVADLMRLPSGDSFLTIIVSNGHKLSFNTSSIDLETLIRRANGFIVKAKKAQNS